MAQARYRQDMPPPGGYANINITRNPAKTLLRSPYLIGGSVVVGCVMAKYYFNRRHQLQLFNLEKNDVAVSLQPFMLAERDRLLLKHLHKNYEEEKEIMKDVPGWEVGTFYGEKLYKTAPPDYHMTENVETIYAHCDPYDFHYQWNHANMLFFANKAYKYTPKNEAAIN